MMNFGKPLASLTPEDWSIALEALRFAAHTEPDEAYMGLDQKGAHRVADQLAQDIGYDVPCQACEVQADIHAEEGHTEPEDTCGVCHG